LPVPLSPTTAVHKVKGSDHLSALSAPIAQARQIAVPELALPTPGAALPVGRNAPSVEYSVFARGQVRQLVNGRRLVAGVFAVVTLLAAA
jgi:hypothetical protein